MEMTAVLAAPAREPQPLRLPEGHRQQELAWRAAHPEALLPLAGSWVVLEGESILAHGANPAELAQEARRQGIATPYLFFVEAPATDVVQLGL